MARSGHAASEVVPDYSYDPNRAWEVLQVKQSPRLAQPISPDAPKPDAHTRFVCISDELQVPLGDVLLHAGDFTNVGLPKDVEKFRHFLCSLPHPYKVVIAGNHDLTFDEHSYGRLWKRFNHPQKFDSQQLKCLITDAPGVTYLEDSGTSINGLGIWGSPWQPEFCDWAFNLPRGGKCLEKWRLIPDRGIDVLLTHGPPIGYGDLCQHGGRAGCVQLLQEVQQRVKPRYHVFGHIHEGYGVSTDGTTVFVNASTCNFNYRPINPPVVFDLPNRQ